MFDLLKTENIGLFLTFLVPGLIISFVRSKFLTGRRPNRVDNFLEYIALSLIFYCIVFPFYTMIELNKNQDWIRSIVWIGITIIGPACLGLLLGAFAQKQLGTLLASKLGLTVVHVVPTSWDWRFSTVPKGGLFVLVTLNDGSSVAGYFGSRSFASSDEKHKDIYLEEEYELEADGNWRARDARIGVLISADCIKHIEFWS